jgi:hypothetical protein
VHVFVLTLSAHNGKPITYYAAELGRRVKPVCSGKMPGSKNLFADCFSGAVQIDYRHFNERETAMKTLALLLTLSLAAAVDGQTTNTPRTYFDAFNATPDALLVKGMSIIATLNNQISFPVEIRAERLTNLQTTNSVYAVSLRTAVAQQLQIDYIDYDELDALIRSVQYISQANNSVTSMDNYEVVFRTRGGLSIAKVGRGNKTVIAMTSGNTNAVRNQMAPFVLDDLARDLVAAKARLDQAAASSQ